MAFDKKNWNRVIALAIFGLLVALFLVVNSPEYLKAGLIYILFIAVALGVGYLSKGVKAPGIDNNFGADFIYGLVAGGGFIALSFTGFAIGVPDVPASLSSVNRWLVVGLLAPIGEEFLFRFVVLGKWLVGFVKANEWIAIPISAVIFSIFHVTAYGAFNFGVGMFVGALIFGVVAGWLYLKTNSLVPGIVAHIVFNTFLIVKLVVGVG